MMYKLCKYLPKIRTLVGKSKGVVIALLILLNSVYPVLAATFTAGMAKRDAPGPFTAAPIVQGDPNNLSSLTDDVVSLSRGTQVSGNFYADFDGLAGSAVVWWTPEFAYDALSATADHYIWYVSSSYFLAYEYDNDRYNLTVGGQSMTVSSNVAAGTTYSLVARWDTQTKIDGTNYACLSIDDSHTCGATTAPTAGAPDATIYIGGNGTTGGGSGLIEGLTIYRRVLYDGTNGINVGNGDEINSISGSTDQDPTLITGSWDVVFALPTNSSTGALSTGTGNAWTHPHLSNLTYTSTTNTGGFMLNGTYSTDSFTPIGGLTPTDSTGTSLSFDGGDQVVTRDHSSLDFTTSYSIEAWVYFDNLNAGYPIVTKWKGAGDQRSYSFATDFNAGNFDEFYLAVDDDGFAPGDAFVTSTNANLTTSTWYHLAATYSGSAVKLYKNGVELSTSTSGTLPSTTFDSTAKLSIGGFDGSTSGLLPGKMDEVRVWNTVRTQNQIKENMYASLTGSEAGLAGYWKLSEGSGQAVADSTANDNDGTLGVDSGSASDDPTWSTSAPAPTLSALAASEKIYAGGYKYTSSAATEGIYIDETVTAGDDWAVRALAHSDGTCTPKIILYDQTGTAEIGSLTGTTTSTRAAPDIFILAGEAPASSTTLRVKLINTASSGVCYWHQVEVLSDGWDDPSIETGTAPTNVGTPTTSAQSSTQAHSDTNSWKVISDAVDEGIKRSITTTSGNYYGMGGWIYADTSGTVDLDVPNFQDGATTEVTSSGNNSWKHLTSVNRASAATSDLQFLSNASQTFYVDDVYSVGLTNVSLTITPASEANSTETTGLRVDGRDSYVESSQSDQTTTSGYVKFNWTPRHSATNSIAFTETTSDDAYILTMSGDSDDYIQLYWNGANIVTMAYSMNGTTGSKNWDASGQISANTTYTAIVSYTGGDKIKFLVDGNTVITLDLIPAAFAAAPDDIYFGSDASSANQGDSVFGSISYAPTATPTPSQQSSSSSSAPTTCTDPASQSPPTIFAGSTTTTTATLFFSGAGSPLTAYGLRFGTKPGVYTYGSLNIAQKSNTSTTINYLLPNTTYYFQLQGRNNCTGGSWSNEFSIKTKPLQLSILPQRTLEITNTVIESQPIQLLTPTPTPTIAGVTTTPTSTPTPTRLTAPEDAVNGGQAPIPEPIEEVTITVLDTQQQPIAGANVTLHSDPKQGITDNEGKVTFTDVERGEHTLIVKSNNFTGEQKLNLIGDKDFFNVSVTIQPKTSYTGTIMGLMIGLVIGGSAVFISLGRRKKALI
ncbi:hypothetical protein HYT02_00645 [Candidatus Gottesmanbacteria bacterium]|nr:hypothetical protein [Candidatus Gottesmanbacteria bacterium]